MEQGPASGVRMRVCASDCALLLELLYAERERLRDSAKKESRMMEAQDIIAFRLGAIKRNDRSARVDKLIERLERF